MGGEWLGLPGGGWSPDDLTMSSRGSAVPGLLVVLPEDVEQHGLWIEGDREARDRRVRLLLPVERELAVRPADELADRRPHLVLERLLHGPDVGEPATHDPLPEHVVGLLRRVGERERAERLRGDLLPADQELAEGGRAGRRRAGDAPFTEAERAHARGGAAHEEPRTPPAAEELEEVGEREAAQLTGEHRVGDAARGTPREDRRRVHLRDGRQRRRRRRRARDGGGALRDDRAQRRHARPAGVRDAAEAEHDRRTVAGRERLREERAEHAARLVVLAEAQEHPREALAW